MSDSEDDAPLAQRVFQRPDSSPDDHLPLAGRKAALKSSVNGNAAGNGNLSHDATSSQLLEAEGTSTGVVSGNNDSSSDDDIPLGSSTEDTFQLTMYHSNQQLRLFPAAQRKKASMSAQKSASAQPKMVKPVAMDMDHREGKRKRQDWQEPPAKKKRPSDAAPARKAKAASSEVTVCVAHLSRRT